MECKLQFLSQFCLTAANDGSELLSKSADDIAQEVKSIKRVISALTPDPLEAKAKSKQLDDILNLLSPIPTMFKEISEVTKTVERWDLKSQGRLSNKININFLNLLQRGSGDFRLAITT